MTSHDVRIELMGVMLPFAGHPVGIVLQCGACGWHSEDLTDRTVAEMAAVEEDHLRHG